MTDETMALLEGEIQRELNNLKRLNPNEDEVKYTQTVNSIVKLTERMTEEDKVNAQWYDSQERREIERERNRLMVQAEAEKNKMDLKRFIIEAAKIVGPAVLTLYTTKHWDKVMAIVMDFEQTGNLKTTASKMLGLNTMYPKKTI